MKKMNKHLVISDYWIGDTLKTQTVAQILKEEDPDCEVHFATKWPQLVRLLENNPYIDKVILGTNVGGSYTSVRRNSGPGWKAEQPPGVLYQQYCGIENPKATFKVYTDPEYDKAAKDYIDEIRNNNPNKLIVAVEVSWRGNNRHNNITRLPIMDILKPLSNKYVFIPVGKQGDRSQIISAKEGNVSTDQFTYTASVIKHCDCIIAQEGGILNLAIGIQTTPIIYGTDFLYALCGPKGSFGTNPEPEKTMGPGAYYGVKKWWYLGHTLNEETYLPEIDNILSKMVRYD